MRDSVICLNKNIKEILKIPLHELEKTEGLFAQSRVEGL